MTIKWKTRSGLNPQAILDKIESVKTIREDGRVSYTGFDYHEAFASLFSMLYFPKAITNELDLDSLVSKGLGKAAREGILTKDSVVKCLNDIAQSELSTREIDYKLLTSLSITGNMPFKNLEIASARIRVVNGPYPKKYASREQVVKVRGFSLEHTGYTKVIVSTRAKSIHGAVSKSLNSIDISRALLSLFSNPGMELMGDSYAPINKIRLGQVHTLHLNSGKAATENFWFEPNFHETRSFEHAKSDVLRNNFRWCLSRLLESPYGVTLTDALLRYVRALDERDHNSAAIRMWGALETLASPGEARYDRIVKRCSFLFDEDYYHSQILEHLREFRNRSVHSGDQSDRAKTFCYQMQFYFRKLTLFHLDNAFGFKSIEEANKFLDSPTDGPTLLDRKAQALRAIEFRKIET